MKEFKYLPHPKEICKWLTEVMPSLFKNSTNEEIINRFKKYASIAGEPLDYMYKADFMGEFHRVCPGSQVHAFMADFGSHILYQNTDWAQDYDPTWLSPLFIAGLFSQILGWRGSASIYEYQPDEITAATRVLAQWALQRPEGDIYRVASPRWLLTSWYSQINVKTIASFSNVDDSKHDKSYDNVANPFEDLDCIGLDNQSQWTNYVHPSILAIKGLDEESFIRRHNAIVNYLSSFRRLRFTEPEDIVNLKVYCLAYIQIMIWCRLNYIHRSSDPSQTADYARVQGPGTRWRIIQGTYSASDHQEYPAWGWEVVPHKYASQICNGSPYLIANGSPVTSMRIMALRPNENMAMRNKIANPQLYVTLGGLYPELDVSPRLRVEIDEFLSDLQSMIPPSAAIDCYGAGLWKLPIELPVTPYIGVADTNQLNPYADSLIVPSQSADYYAFPEDGADFGRYSAPLRLRSRVDDPSPYKISQSQFGISDAFISKPRSISTPFDEKLGLITLRWLTRNRVPVETIADPTGHSRQQKVYHYVPFSYDW